MRKYDLYWKSNPDWFDYDDNLFPVMTDNAPPEAIESYNNYLRQKGYEVTLLDFAAPPK